MSTPLSPEAKHKHLDFIQNIVTRLGNNGFQMKGWAITLVSAILALASSKDAIGKQAITQIAFLPAIMFWILDGYFLWQERLFRGLYNDVAKKPLDQIDYSMDIRPYNGGRNTWEKAIFSKTLNVFYGILLVLLSIIAWWAGRI